MFEGADGNGPIAGVLTRHSPEQSVTVSNMGALVVLDDGMHFDSSGMSSVDGEYFAKTS